MPSSNAVKDFDEEEAQVYDERIRKLAPGYDSLHEAIASILQVELAEEARILLVGAGTGEEVAQLAQVSEAWHFTAVDPSAEMLERCNARARQAGVEERLTCEATPIEAFDAAEPYDAATSIFVAHFIQDLDDKRGYFSAIYDQMKRGAPLVVADLFESCTGDSFEELMSWWRAAFERAGATDEEVEERFRRIRKGISFVDEPALGELLGDAGFQTPTRFWQSFLWGAWLTRSL